jgi:hypothetical protein
LSFSQELNVGGGVGTDKDLNYLGLCSYVEFRPNKAIFSLNLDPSYHTSDDLSFLTIPLYLKVIIGNTFRVCPSIGLFARTNGNRGWLTSLNLELLATERTTITAQCSLTKDYWNEDGHSPGGHVYEFVDSSKWLWFNIGIKRTLKARD